MNPWNCCKQYQRGDRVERHGFVYEAVIANRFVEPHSKADNGVWVEKVYFKQMSDPRIEELL